MNAFTPTSGNKRKEEISGTAACFNPTAQIFVIRSEQLTDV